jgi:alkanesulfonate monooxygenase SsuD/methylene tetrahydromethanopterin reductase-like flavin-dependent oxidoreductase (luciferase family)
MTQSTSARGMKLGIVLRTTEGGLQGKRPMFREIREMAQAAERVGLDSIWLPDHLLYRFSERGEVFWEVFTMLSALER